MNAAAVQVGATDCRAAPYQFATEPLRAADRPAYATRPGESEILRRMFELRRGRASARVIAAALDAEGLRNRSGTEWKPRLVAHVMSRIDRFMLDADEIVFLPKQRR